MGYNLESTEVNSWAYRHEHAIEEFVKWYELLQDSRDANNERTEGQLTMLSSVLYLLLEPKEYKKLTSGISKDSQVTLV